MPPSRRSEIQTDLVVSVPEVAGRHAQKKDGSLLAVSKENTAYSAAEESCPVKSLQGWA